MDQYSAERDELKKLQALFEEAVEKNQMETFAPHVSADFSIVNFTDRAFNNYTTFCEQWKKTRAEMLGSGSFKTTLEPDSTQFYGDIAVAHGSSKNQMVDRSGNRFDFTSNWTVVFKKEEGQWKVIRGHSSLDPFKNPMIKHAFKKMLFMGVGLAVVGGGLLGWLLAR